LSETETPSIVEKDVNRCSSRPSQSPTRGQHQWGGACA